MDRTRAHSPGDEVASISSTAAIDPRNDADITAQADSDSKTSSSDGTGSNNDADSEAEKIEERAWKCHKCGRHNHLHKLRCPPPCRACKGQSWKSTRTSTEGCEIVWGVERNGDECAICGDGGGECKYNSVARPIEDRTSSAHILCT